VEGAAKEKVTAILWEEFMRHFEDGMRKVCKTNISRTEAVLLLPAFKLQTF
jgi:hypothetical protein